MKKKYGQITGINHQTKDGMQIDLDNGVSFWLSCNNGYLHLSFSGIDYDKMLNVRDLPNGRLANKISIEYSPKKEG